MNEFIFKSCELNEFSGEILAVFELNRGTENYSFTEKIKFNRAVTEKIEPLALKQLLTLIHLALGISYWKSYCPSKILFENFSLSKDQANFWQTVYTKGLGEFFYRNQIDFRGLIKFPFNEISNLDLKHNLKANKYLLGIGGGKDSIVSAERLNEKNIDFESFVVETGREYEIANNVVKLIGKPVFKVSREVDTISLAKLKNPYNGHIPISLIYAVLGVAASLLYGYSGFLTSNEASANEGNLEYLGYSINHQWSKSNEFETLFKRYIHKYISPDIDYYSLLRSLTEFEISKEFSNLNKYFSVFSSCNRNFSITKGLKKGNSRWCGSCPKCVFVFIMLAAFLTPEELSKIFDKNIFDDLTLLPTVKELIGESGHKPFECVGTSDEVLKALKQIKQKGLYDSSAIIKML
jgi:hypothetical protein